MSKIRILSIPSDNFGVGKYRIIDPFTYISNNYSDDFEIDIKFDVPTSDLFFKSYDIVFFHSFIHKSSHEDNIARIKWLKKQGIKVIMDIDDYWTVDLRHPMYNQLIKHEIHKKKIELIQLVDYVSVTTPYFKNTVKQKLFVKNIVVFPNAINPIEEQFNPTPIKSEKIRFGWLGGSSHLFDIKLMEDGVAKILDSYRDKVQFVLCGFDDRGFIHEMNKQTGETKQRPIKPEETVWYKYENIFTKNYSYIDENYKRFLHEFKDYEYNTDDKSYVRRWTRDIKVYAYNYNYFDVSLAPLVNNIFNNNKSELKIIESGFHKKALIASDIIPYNNILINAIEPGGKINEKGNALLVDPNKNHKQWDQYMKKLIENPNLIEMLGNNLYETVKDKYSLPNVCKDRVEFFKTIINN